LYDALIISDLHLGSDNCQARALVAFLDDLRDGRTQTQRLILNGDVFDSMDFRRLKKHHWKVLSLIRKLSDQIEIVWINGNHDGPAEIVSHLLGVEIQDEMMLESGGRKILIHHGHRFDRFIDEHPILTAIGDFAYRVLQKLDSSHAFARSAKNKSKTFLRCAAQIETRSVEYAKRLGCHAVCCGHTHFTAAKEGEVAYYNSGCWTEKPCHYLAVRAGRVEVRAYEFDGADDPALVAGPAIGHNGVGFYSAAPSCSTRSSGLATSSRTTDPCPS
jgi:UDP-2,3-diacylglucosamine pyrophosphatase LpxH